MCALAVDVLLDATKDIAESSFISSGLNPFITYLVHMPQGGDPLKRNENDAAALQAKVAAKKAAQEAAANAAPAGSGPVPRKKVPSKKTDNNNTMDDLLSAGLTGNKKRVK